MTWSVEWDDRARRELRALDPGIQQRILKYLRERIATEQNPRRFGRALSGTASGLWRYRVGNYRLICQVEEQRLTVLVVRVGHRKDIYQSAARVDR